VTRRTSRLRGPSPLPRRREPLRLPAPHPLLEPVALTSHELRQVGHALELRRISKPFARRVARPHVQARLSRPARHRALRGLSGSVAARMTGTSGPRDGPEHGLAVMVSALRSTPRGLLRARCTPTPDCDRRRSMKPRTRPRGEPVAESSSTDLRDLAETRAAIHGDDAASRRLLASIASSLHVKGSSSSTRVRVDPRLRHACTSRALGRTTRFATSRTGRRPSPGQWDRAVRCPAPSCPEARLRGGSGARTGSRLAFRRCCEWQACQRQARRHRHEPDGSRSRAVNKDNGKSSSRLSISPPGSGLRPVRLSSRQAPSTSRPGTME